MSYIEREALIELINEKNRNTCNGSLSCVQIKRIIETIPFADVVEVVRCKNCEHKVDFKGRVMCSRTGKQSEIDGEWYGLVATDNDHYCSYGKRKEGAV